MKTEFQTKGRPKRTDSSGDLVVRNCLQSNKPMLQEVEEIKHKVVSKIKQDAANKESSVIYDVYDGRVQLITMCKHHRCR